MKQDRPHRSEGFAEQKHVSCEAAHAFVVPAVLPDGRGGFTPCPTVLTEEEAVRYLRLDLVGHKSPSDTLRYYRERKKLKATRIGRKLFYTRKSLDEFLDRMTC